MTFFVIDKTHRNAQNPRRRQRRRFESAASVAAFMWGRRISNYCVIKTGEQGDQVVPLLSADVADIQLALEQA